MFFVYSNLVGRVHPSAVCRWSSDGLYPSNLYLPEKIYPTMRIEYIFRCERYTLFKGKIYSLFGLLCHYRFVDRMIIYSLWRGYAFCTASGSCSSRSCELSNSSYTRCPSVKSEWRYVSVILHCFHIVNHFVSKIFIVVENHRTFESTETICR